jgi:hypothetical protein
MFLPARRSGQVFEGCAKAFGGHDRATLRLLEAYGQKRVGDQRCQWLKAGMVIRSCAFGSR